MWSTVALVALAPSGSLDLTAASLCKPCPSLSSSTIGLIPSGTATSAAASRTAVAVVVKSVIDGGGFSDVPPGGGVPGFTIQGDAGIIVGPCYEDDGRKDLGCLSLKAINKHGQPLDSLLTQSVSITSILNHWPQSDGDIELPFQPVCNTFGVNKGNWWERITPGKPQATMEDCSQLCRAEGSNYGAFGLDTTSGLGIWCALSYYKLGTLGIDLNATYSFWWSDADCYECHDCQAV